jgi:serine/threonine protein kinase
MDSLSFRNNAAKIKREISTMKLVKHPNVVQLLEVIMYKLELIAIKHS